MQLTVAGTTLTVNMTDGDGLGNAVNTAQKLTEAAKLVNKPIWVSLRPHFLRLYSTTVYRLKIEPIRLARAFPWGQ